MIANVCQIAINYKVKFNIALSVQIQNLFNKCSCKATLSFGNQLNS